MVMSNKRYTGEFNADAAGPLSVPSGRLETHFSSGAVAQLSVRTAARLGCEHFLGWQVTGVSS